MTFGRQNNLTRRAVRPNGRMTRDLRRRGVGYRATLLDLTKGGGPRPSLVGRLVASVRRLLGRR